MGRPVQCTPSSSVEVVTALCPHVAGSSLKMVVQFVAVAIVPLREEDHALVVLAVVVVDQHALLSVGNLEIPSRVSS